MNLAMNPCDLDLFDAGKLKAFAVPYSEGVKCLHTGDVVGIKEQCKRLTITAKVIKETSSGGKYETDEKILLGVLYRSDETIKWKDAVPAEYDTAEHWSHAKCLPDYAVRRHAIVNKVETYSLKAFPDDALQLMCLDYFSQGNLQTLMTEYLSAKNYELLYSWWKKHYPVALKKSDDPLTAVLYISNK